MSPRSAAIVTLFVGPAVAALDQLMGYFVTPPWPPSQNKLPLLVTSAVAAIAIAAAIATALRLLRRSGDLADVDRFLARLAIAMNAFFLLVVLAGFGIPTVVLHPTD